MQQQMRNAEMVTQMRSEGFSAHDMRFIRGYKTPVSVAPDLSDASMWLAVKESQNALLDKDAGDVTLYMRFDGGPGGKKYAEFKGSSPGQLKFHLWVQKKEDQKPGSKLWTRMGVYALGPIRKETHHVIKRKRPYETDMARTASRVSAA